MTSRLISDALWARVEPHIPTPRRRRGRHPIGDRAVLEGILFVLKSGAPWQDLPREHGSGSGMTCLRRLRRWQSSGAWAAIRAELSTDFLSDAIDWSRAEPISRRLRGSEGDRRRRARRSRVDEDTLISR